MGQRVERVWVLAGPRSAHVTNLCFSCLGLAPDPGMLPAKPAHACMAQGMLCSAWGRMRGGRMLQRTTHWYIISIISFASFNNDSSKTPTRAFTRRSFGSGYLMIWSGLCHSSFVTAHSRGTRQPHGGGIGMSQEQHAAHPRPNPHHI